MSRVPGKRKREVWERDQWLCCYCGVRVSHSSEIGLHNDTATVDHVVPISKGGGNSKVNLVTACSFCNRTKASGSKPRRIRTAGQPVTLPPPAA